MKYKTNNQPDYDRKSPPARGAWIEILLACGPFTGAWRRPPRGGRGLKSMTIAHHICSS